MTAPRLTIDEAAATLAAGGLVAFGTETVYGLGANATDPEAVAKIYAAKRRPAFDPLIVHLADGADLHTDLHTDLHIVRARAIEVVARWTPRQVSLAAAFWPGPLTMLAPRGRSIPELVTSGLPDVAVRVPGTPAARELIAKAGVPIAAPSANLFGRISPTTVEHVLDQLGDAIDGVVDTGPCGVGVESTVIRVPDDDGPLVVLRLGGTSLEALAEVAGEVVMAVDEDRAELQAETSPGRLPSHYAPRVPLRVVERAMPSRDEGLLAWRQPVAGFAAVEVLSESGDDVEAAARLFAAMRRLEASGVRAIQAERVPSDGLGRAINDRLARASHAG